MHDCRWLPGIAGMVSHRARQHQSRAQRFRHRILDLERVASRTRTRRANQIDDDIKPAESAKGGTRKPLASGNVTPGLGGEQAHGGRLGLEQVCKTRRHRRWLRAVQNQPRSLPGKTLRDMLACAVAYARNENPAALKFRVSGDIKR